MQQTGFISTPITRSLLYALLSTSLLSSLTSIKPNFHLQVVPHLFPQHQFFRVLSFQSIYANSGELLFGLLLLYNLRQIERLFGSRKFLSLLLYTYAATSIITPTLLLTGWMATKGRWNYLPPGPTPLLFAILAQYHAAVPGTYKFSLLLPGGAGEIEGSDKIYSYLLAVQLAACQLPGSLVGAAVGWIVGYAWRLDLLPKTRWRVGRGIVRLLGGDVEGKEYEALRRRLREGETEQSQAAERPIVSRVFGQFMGR
ncbi:hypothetical protein BZA77DRAFT_299387 [Pyronema omphalodes]|nr:hypothetical protein BZA77DRAFT_299387 [Pyronema omphalodes]